MKKRDPRSLGKTLRSPSSRAPTGFHRRLASRLRACPAGPCRHFSLRFLSKLLRHAVWTSPLGRRCSPRAGAGRQLSRLERQSISASPAASLAAARAARTHPSRLIAKAFRHRPLPRWGRRGQMGSRRAGRALGVSPKGAGDWGLGWGGGEQQCGSSKDSPRGQNLETRLERRRDG